MKTLKNIFMLFSFAAAMILFASTAQAQSANTGDNAVKTTEVKACPSASKSTCTVSNAAASSCCKSKGASASAASCHSTVGSGSASNASAGDAPAATRKTECAGKNKACCASKAKKEGSSLE